ncbi:hypothetical protein RND81_12G043300 [Saponaria officinalis]|uniref:Trichome birefringence-like N-terminal domain-containing protein n=1 Tax=Saponaria officinalis TaxID=3572 RepID=A0AAW1H6K6_SAPOF
MAEVTKYQLISNNNNNNNNIISELKPYFSVFKTRKSSSFIYGVVLIFVLFSVFLAFFPATSSTSSPWFVNIFAVNSTSPAEKSDGSHFPSVYSYFFPNSSQFNSSRSQINSTFPIPISNNSQNLNNSQVFRDKVGNFPQINPQISANSSVIYHEKQMNQSSELFPDKVGNFEQNNTTIPPKIDQNPKMSPNNSVINHEKQKNLTVAHQSSNSSSNATITPQISSNSTKIGSGLEVNSSDLSASLSKNQGKINGNESVTITKKGNEVEKLVGCDLYDGNWVKDESYPLYKPGSCKLVDEQFNCFLNGRPDSDYQKLKWKPNSCSLPRLNGGHMLELLRGKRLVFVGDSLNRNMWESLVCILKNSVKDKKKVYEAFGRHHFRTEASYSFVFKDYNCTVEFFVSPFLVQQWEVKDKNGTTQETLRLDLIVSDADQFKNADYIVFNTGHWWTHDKTSKGEDYYQEGSHVYKQLDVTEAFRRAITTWARWVDANIDPQRTHVLFRGYSASHFSGGQWNSGGQCDSETEPIKNETYLTEYPWKMKVFESVIKGMKIPVSYLNVTRLTDYRKDGHPSVYRKQHLSGDEKKSPLRYQDCSHWCLPGVPDSWNELLYAELLRKQYSDHQQTNKT